MKMKILAIAVLACFVMSGVPVLAAEEDTDEPTPAKRLEQLRERYKEVREQYKVHRQMYINARQKWLAIKNQFAAGRDRATFDTAREFFDTSAGYVVRWLEVLERKVNVVEFLDEAKKAELTAEIEGYIDTLKADHEAIVAAEDKEALRAAVKQAREDWNAIRPQAKRIIGEVLAARAQQAINKAENVSARIDAKIAELKEEGKDVVALEDLNQDFKEKIILAQEKHDRFVEKLEEVKTSENARALLKEADEFLRSVNRYLVQAHATLRKVVREIRHAETGQLEPEPVVVEVEEVTETPLTETAAGGGE